MPHRRLRLLLLTIALIKLLHLQPTVLLSAFSSLVSFRPVHRARGAQGKKKEMQPRQGVDQSL